MERHEIEFETNNLHTIHEHVIRFVESIRTMLGGRPMLTQRVRFTIETPPEPSFALQGVVTELHNSGSDEVTGLPVPMFIVMDAIYLAGVYPEFPDLLRKLAPYRWKQAFLRDQIGGLVELGLVIAEHFELRDDLKVEGADAPVHYRHSPEGAAWYASATKGRG